MDAEHADRMVRLDTFGELIGDTDRHFGNLSFFAEEAKEPTLTPTPAYDVLPMVFAPKDANLIERQFAPGPPTALNLHPWHDVGNHALRYWTRLCEEEGLSVGFRRIVAGCRDTPARLIDESSWRTSAIAAALEARMGRSRWPEPAGPHRSPRRDRIVFGTTDS